MSFQSMVVLILKQNDRIASKPTLRAIGQKMLSEHVKSQKSLKFKVNTTYVWTIPQNVKLNTTGKSHQKTQRKSTKVIKNVNFRTMCCLGYMFR